MEIVILMFIQNIIIDNSIMRKCCNQNDKDQKWHFPVQDDLIPSIAGHRTQIRERWRSL